MRSISSIAIGLLFAAFVGSAHAVLNTPTGVTYTYGTQTAVGTVYVTPSTAMTANLTVTMTGGSSWSGTGWRINTTAGAFACFNNANTTISPSTIAIPTTSPAAAGTYNGYFVAYTNGTCTTGASGTLTASNTVIVDNTVPTIPTATIASNNASPTWAKTGDVITLTFTVNDDSGFVRTPVVTISGGAAAVSGSYPNYTATRTALAADTQGTIPFTINVTDLAGNAAVARTAITSGSNVTLDRTIPTITPATMASNNSTTTLAKVGDIVTLSFTTNDANSTQTPVVTISGSAASVVATGGPATALTWTASRTMDGSEPTGAVTFTINVNDLAGNPAAQRTTVTSGAAVTFDKTPPTLTTVTITSNNAVNAAYARTGSIVTLSFTASESVKATPTVTIAGHAVTPTPAGPSAGPYTATYTMIAGDVEGVIPFTINFNDLAGNAGTQVTATTNASSVTFDKTPPTVSSINLAGTSPTSAASVQWTATFSESVVGVTTARFGVVNTGLGGAPAVTAATGPGAAWTVTASTGSGTGTLGLNLTSVTGITDQAGNTLSASVPVVGQVYTVDRTIPTIPTATIASNNASSTWAKTGNVVTVTFTVNDNTASVQTPVVTIRGAAATVSGSYPNFTASRTMLVTDTEGVVTFTINVSDTAGNAAAQRTAITSGSNVTFDRTSPTIPTATIASNNATTTLAKAGDTVTLTLTTSDTNGVQTPVVTIAGGAAVVAGGPTNWTATRTMLAGDTQGTVAFTIDVNDTAGNPATQRTAITSGSNVTFDSAAPTLSPVSIASNNANPAAAIAGNTITLTFTANESVRATPAVTIAGHSVTPTPAGPSAGPYTASYVLTGADSLGLVSFTINFTDLVGNAGTQVTSTTNGSSVTVFSNAATALGFSQQPSNTSVGVAVSPAITVQIKNAAGNVVTTDNSTTVTLSSSCSGLSGTLTRTAVSGVATFNDISHNVIANGCTLTANSSPVLTPDTSITFNITALPVSQLVYTQQPTSTTPNTAISPAIKVELQNSQGQTVTTSTATVSLSIGTNPGSGTLGGTTSVAAAAGVATFNNVSINNVGNGYTLVATSGALTKTSNTFNISTATKLVFFQGPTNTPVSPAVITPSVSVQIQDALGNVVTSRTDVITLVFGANPGGATLNGGTSVSVAAVAGVATFNNLTINTAGTGYTLVASAPAGSGLTSATSNSFNVTGTQMTCYTDSFTDLNNWSVGNETPAGQTIYSPTATSGRLHMTSATTQASTYATLQRLFPASGNKVVVEFLHYAYGGSNPGADGVGVILSDASQAPTAGAFGGSMGYAPKRTDQSGDTTHPGFVGGWLGMAIDEWGNFSANTEGRTGGNAPGRTIQSVSLRGSGSGYTGYNYLTGTSSSPGGKGIDLDYTTQAHLATLGPGYQYRIIVDHSDAVHAYASVERDMLQGAGYQYLISPFDAKAAAGQVAVPANWYLSFVGATGASTNIHEIANLSVCSNSQSTIALDHIEIDHLASGFPGIASTITIKACADAACSTLYLNSVSATLSATNATGTGTNTWTTSPVTFTGGQTTVTLTHQTGTTANVTLGTTSTTPTTANSTTCYIGAVASCNMLFTPVSFDAVQTAAAPATPIFTKLTGVNFSLDVLAVTSGAVNTTFTGAVTVDLVNPTAASGNCTDTNTGLTTASNYTFTSGTGLDNGRHAFTFNYPYAALNVKVRIRDAGSNVYCSSDNFVIRPQLLTLSTTSSLDPTANTLAAGADFNLTANAGVTSGYAGTIPVIDPTLAALKDHNGATIAGGSLTGTFGVSNGTTATGTFQYQDVGTLTLNANAVIDAQFFNQDQHTGVYAGIDHGVNGDCVYNSASNTMDGNGRYGCNIGSTALGPLGRFVPDHFTLTAGSVTAACNGFTYMGEPFGIAYTLEARNKSDVKTAKYVSANPPYPSIPAYTALPLPSQVGEDGASQGTDLAGRISGFTVPNWAAGQNVLSTAAAVFSRPSTPDGPYDSLTIGVKMVDGAAVIANRDMNAATATDCAAAANCDAKKLPTGNPTIVRFGYLKLNNAFGSALLNLNVPMQAMYLSGPSTFAVNTLDDCSTVAPRANIAIGNWTGTLASGNFGNTNLPVANVVLSGGSGTVVIAKPTGGQSGSADIALNLGTSVAGRDNCLAAGFTAPTGAASLTWLRGDWCTGANYAKDPNAHLTLGVSNSRPFIYLREKY